MAPHTGTVTKNTCVLQQIRAVDLLFAEGQSAPSSRNIFYLNPKHIARESVRVPREHQAYDRNPLATELCTGCTLQWVAKKSSCKSILMALREQPNIHEHHYLDCLPKDGRHRRILLY